MRLPSQRPCTAGRAARRRAGVTLIELLVVLVVMGIGAAVVVPTVRTAAPPRPLDESPLAAAQRLAMQRGESLRLDIAPDGAWLLRRSAEPDDTVAHGGADTTATGDGAILMILPSGSCVPLALTARAPAWDPVGCRWAREAAR